MSKTRWTIRSLLVTALSILLIGCNELDDAIGKLGFQRFQPPRTTIQPGTLVVIEKSGWESIITPVCWREQAFPGLADPKPNVTIAQEIAKKVKNTLKLEAEYLDKIKGQAQFSRIQDITLNLSNTTVPEYSDADVYGAFPNRLKECDMAVARREERGQTVYTTMQVIRADVTYKISTDTSLDGSIGLPPEVLEGLRLELGGSTANDLEQTITGSGLTWGFKPDTITLRRIPGAVNTTKIPGERLSLNEQRVLTAQLATVVAAESDADKLSQI